MCVLVRCASVKCYQLFTQVQKEKRKKKKKKKKRKNWRSKLTLGSRNNSVYILIMLSLVPAHTHVLRTRVYDTNLHGPARYSLLQCGGRLTGLLLGLYRDIQIQQIRDDRNLCSSFRTLSLAIFSSRAISSFRFLENFVLARRLGTDCSSYILQPSTRSFYRDFHSKRIISRIIGIVTS